jgi:hypothetical protein
VTTPLELQSGGALDKGAGSPPPGLLSEPGIVCALSGSHVEGVTSKGSTDRGTGLSGGFCGPVFDLLVAQVQKSISPSSNIRYVSYRSSCCGSRREDC